MNLAWIIGVAAFLGIIWPLIQMGRNFDKEDDPKTTERKEQLGQWLSGRGNRTLESRMQTTSETFLYLFDRIFKGKGSPLEQSIWMGFLLSPAFLLLADGLNIIDFLGSSGAGTTTKDSLFPASLSAANSLTAATRRATANRTSLTPSTAQTSRT